MRARRVVIAGLLAAAAWLSLSPYSAGSDEAGCPSLVVDLVTTGEADGGHAEVTDSDPENERCSEEREVRIGQTAAALLIAGSIALATKLADDWRRGRILPQAQPDRTRSHYE